MTGEDVPATMPERIGGYELLFPIGSGGMGTVYLGRSEIVPGLQRHVAVKLMHSELRANPEIAPQLMQEATIAAGIHHPNVVAVLEAAESPHGVFLVMDYVEGDTLAGLIRAARKRSEAIPIRIAIKILRDALSGLHAAHELKDSDGQPLELVHRDFSPHNILVSVDGRSLLTDFGIAKALSHISTTATGIVKGKIGYMAPEQARGERVDRRSDVWAAGVVAWETLTAHRLFRGSNDAATLLRIVSGKRPPAVSSQRPDVPERIDQVVAAALESKPSRRLASARALRQQLEAAVADIGGAADEGEVAAYVQELVGDKLVRTRERTESVLALRAQLAELGAEEPTTQTDTLGAAPESKDFSEASSTRAALSRVSGPLPRSRARWVAWGAAAAIGVGGLVAFMSSRANSTTSPTPPPPSLDGALASDELPGALKLVANAPIAQLQLDGRTIVLPRATRELEVPVGATTPGRVLAIAEDGRQVEASLSGGQRELRLDFSASAVPSSPITPSAVPSAHSLATPRSPTTLPSPVAPRPRPTTPEPGEDLAESPYGSK